MITILQKSEKFTPSGNPIVWQIQSDNQNLRKFRMKLIDDASESTIQQLDIYPTPKTPQSAYAMFTKSLDNVVNWEVNNDSFQFVVPIEKTIRSYRVKITEMVVSGSTLVPGDQYDNLSDVNYIFNAELDRMSFQNYLQVKYVATANTTASFLTKKPNQTKVNDFSFEQLYFIQDGSITSLTARVRTYTNSGQLMDTFATPILDVDKYHMFRLNVSPKALSDALGVSMTGVGYYVVDVVDGYNKARTEQRVYFYQEVPCGYEWVNLLWVNSLGGIDSFQFLSPQETVNYTQFKMKKNIYGIDSEGLYKDSNDGIFNPSDVIISNTAVTSTQVVSPMIKDAEAYWLQELFQSKQVFVELTDGELVPVVVTTNSYAIPRTRFNVGSPTTVSLTFELADGMIPTGAHAYSSKANAIDFIDSQMNTLTQNLPGYDIQVGNPYTVKHYTDNYSDKYE